MNFRMIMEKQSTTKKQNIDSFIVYIKTKDIFQIIAKDVEKRIHTSNQELKRPRCQKEKVIDLMKEELGGKILTEFPGLRSKIYYLTDENNECGKAKDKKMYIKTKLKF